MLMITAMQENQPVKTGVCWTEKQATAPCHGQTQTPPQAPHIRRSMLETPARPLRGESPETAVPSRETARVHTVRVNAASQAAAITPVPAAALDLAGHRLFAGPATDWAAHRQTANTLPIESWLG